MIFLSPCLVEMGNTFDLVFFLLLFFLNFKIVKHWVKQLTQQRGYTDQMVEEANAVIFTFGSYRLGVSDPFLPLPLS